MNRVLLIALLLTSASHAQWSTDPANNLIVGYGLLPEIASDSAGGCYITYIQQVGIYDRILLERLNRYGYKPWGTRRQIVGALPGQTFAKIAEDGLGGVTVSFSDVLLVSPHEPPIMRLRVQRVDSSGNFLWGPTGVRVSLSETNQGDQAVVSDGNGGCIVAWKDTLGGLRINRIDATGTRVWGDSGKSIGNSSERPLLVEDNSAGCIVGIQGLTTTLFRRLDHTGNTIWSATLTDFPTTKTIPDGSGGVITAGMKFISYNNGDPLWAAKAQRVDSLGQILWGNDGLMLGDSLHGLFFNPPSITLERNTDGGGTVAWGKRVRPSVIRIFVQRVRSEGTFVFPDTGIQVSAVDSGGVGTWGIISSLEDSKIFINADARNNGSTLAQRIDSTGSRLWNNNDVALSSIQLGDVKSVTDGNGGAIILGFVQSDFSVRAQQVSRNGNLGVVITSMADLAYKIPHEFTLHQNYPNPFNSSTIIQYTVPASSWISITLFNLLGQRLLTLVNSHHLPGRYSVYFRADGFPSGVYYYRMSTEGGQSGMHTRKLLIIK